MRFVIRRIADAMIGRPGLPDSAQPKFTPRRSRIRYSISFDFSEQRAYSAILEGSSAGPMSPAGW